ncbi:hypothetical protein QN277_008154 [Acacia crassicarpa]|uniref:Uncharacterized protein n=1 Tax=Acacia crassicarpa TaxID=499986 RepID=A0AAE1IQ12_9FABA|nr:hypothetical protein QN277_008154 [Acacia crassicarpa]
MVYLWFIALLCIFSSSSAHRFYDSTNCSTDPNTYPGSRYTCKTPQDPCQTYLVFRSNQHFQKISEISKLFHNDPHTLLQENNHLNLNSSSQFIEAGKEVLIPVNCSCSGGFYQVSFRYVVPENTTFSEIACGVYEGLLKSSTLEQDNLNTTRAGDELNIPLRCACPDNSSTIGKKLKNLMTYPIILGDTDSAITAKFGISTENFREVNDLQQFSTLFPQTTVLIPLRDDKIKIIDILDSSPAPTSGFLPTLPMAKTRKNRTSLYIASSVIVSLILIMAILVGVLYFKALRKWKSGGVRALTPSTSIAMSPMRGSSTTSCLSPDLLAGIKYCLANYSIEELKMATKNFSEETKKSGSVFKGLITNLEVMIKRMRFEDTRRVIDFHSKINHINIVNLLGVCYDESDLSWSYLVFEWPKNGCLRDCLSDGSNLLRWKQRTQIAFDIATVLHYLHCCAFPSYAHLNVSSRNIFITEDFRGKLADIAAPENHARGLVSEKVDIFAFGVVLLELVSARENIEGKLVKDSMGFLGEGGGGGGNEGGCFEGLRSFMDPNLKEDYHLAEALCLAVLAKACVADDPLHRPTMDDIMKVLAKMVSPQQPEK